MGGARFRVAIASDHAGREMRRGLARCLREWGHEVIDRGPDGEDPVDYPLYAREVAARVLGGEARFGLLVCGTGIGMSIAANRFAGIRAALLYDAVSARHARLHNDANVAVFGARTMRFAEAEERLRIFLAQPFEGGRHARRVELIERLGPGAAGTPSW